MYRENERVVQKLWPWRPCRPRTSTLEVMEETKLRVGSGVALQLPVGDRLTRGIVKAMMNRADGIVIRGGMHRVLLWRQ